METEPLSENYVITDAQTPWAAAKTDDKEKAEAIVTFMKYITSRGKCKATYPGRGGVPFSEA